MRALSRCLAARLAVRSNGLLAPSRALGVTGRRESQEDRLSSGTKDLRDFSNSDPSKITGFGRHLSGFLSDSCYISTRRRAPTEMSYLYRGHVFSSTAVNEVRVTKPAGGGGKHTQNNMAKKKSTDEEVADMKILRTLVKYLWLKDNLEFRMRVILALGLLVGAKLF